MCCINLLQLFLLVAFVVFYQELQLIAQLFQRLVLLNNMQRIRGQVLSFLLPALPSACLPAIVAVDQFDLHQFLLRFINMPVLFY